MSFSLAALRSNELNGAAFGGAVFFSVDRQSRIDGGIEDETRC